MSALKLGVKGGIFVGALILLSACSSEDLTQNTYKKENESVEVIPEKTVPKKVTGPSVKTSRVIARVMNPKILLKKTLNGVEDLIGKAHFTRREGNAVVLQYKKDWCVLDIFFYGREGQQESTYYEFRSREKTDMNISECINKMVNN
ncbi:MAG: hypothetical protein CMM17_01650 [Rhodospirillaceae bacterium]|jgi:hypothetical protein|nr:hypothetical protein [Rhodospirillaceae bacterium]